jgi:hypothetical protein
MLPNTLIANMRCQRCRLIASKRDARSTTPALLTRPPSGGSSASMRANIALTCASSDTSACSASARPPAARMRSASASAAAASRA